MLQVKGLTVSYGGTISALRDATMSVETGGVVALLGSNGAGKTTLLRAISGTLHRHGGRIESGRVTFEGEDVRSMNPRRRVGAGIVQVPEGRHVFGRLTVEENLRTGLFAGRSRGEQQAILQRIYEKFPVLAERRNQRASLLSGGEQQMLAIGRALMSSPRLLMLDEPSLGLAPRMVAQVGAVIADINAAGTTVLLIEQNAAMALSVAQFAYVLELGRVSLSGSSAELAATDTVRHLYLGHSASSPTDQTSSPHDADLAPDGSAGPRDASTELGRETAGEPVLARWTR